MMMYLSRWLQATWLCDYFSSTSWVVPTVQSIHILGVALVFASMSLLSLRLLGFSSSRQSVSVAALPTLAWLWPALVVLLLTGLVMVVSEPERELLNQTFLLKMVLVAVAAVASGLLRRSMLRHRQAWDAPEGRKAAKPVGVLFFLLWVAIIVCGRWIAYTQ